MLTLQVHERLICHTQRAEDGDDEAIEVQRDVFRHKHHPKRQSGVGERSQIGFELDHGLPQNYWGRVGKVGGVNENALGAAQANLQGKP